MLIAIANSALSKHATIIGDARPPPSALPPRGRTPLMLAADSEHACGAAAEVLLGAKADVNVAGQGGKTALPEPPHPPGAPRKIMQ